MRAAVLGSSVQRAALPKYPSRSRPAVKRRLVAGVLVLLSLALITLSFRAGEGGGVEAMQDGGATLLRPLQVGIERLVSPFRDLYGYTRGLVDAKDENERLRRELRGWRDEAIRNRALADRYVEIKNLLKFRAPGTYPGPYRAVAASVIGVPIPTFDQHVEVNVGSSDGVRVNDTVVNGDGLVGRVTEVSSGTAQVTLMTDAQSAVTGVLLRGTKPLGIVKRDPGGSDLLIMEWVKKSEVVHAGDHVVTAGRQLGELSSLYPQGILIGKVVSATQSDVELYKDIQVEPAVDFDSVHSVIVLVPKDRSRR